MRRVLIPLLAIALISLQATAEDWPTYMHDNSRSGISGEKLSLPLSLHWRISPPVVHKPAWPGPQMGNPGQKRLLFDNAFATVVVGDTVYFGSSVDNKIHAADVTTGHARWSFTTEGAVRLAPTIADGKVYAGSDDGYAYCLDSNDGKLVWKVRCGPNSRKMIGHGRIVSPWPVRTGIVVENGRAFFGGGVVSMEKVYIRAVDANTGKTIWTSSSDHRTYGLSAQGYALLDANRLVTPAGRNTPFGFDAANGDLIYATGGNKIIGGSGTYALLSGGKLVSGTQGKLSVYDLVTGTLEASFSAYGLLMSKEWMFTRGGNSIRRLDRSYIDKMGELDALAEKKEIHWKVFRDKSNALRAESVRWRIEAFGIKTMVLAGDTIFAGGRDKILAIDMKDGNILWREEVEGTVNAITVANGKLLASTEKGDILCFASGRKPTQAAKAIQANVFAAKDIQRAKALAEAILAKTESKRGYCVVAGSGSAPLASELAARSEMRIFYVLPDAAEASAQRQELESAGVMANKVTVITAGTGDISLPDYFANLVVVEEGQDTSRFDRLLKPHGGMLFTFVQGKGGPVLVKRRGALPGAGNWTHQYANAGNTGASTDTAVRVPLSLLWYGEPGGNTQQDTHLRGPAPLVIDGRVYVQCETILNVLKPDKNTQYILCFDAYNGVEYWRRDVPGANRKYMKWYESNLAVDHDSLFVASRNKCFRFDGRTGELLATYETPPVAGTNAPLWSYVAVVDGILVGSVTTRSGVPLHNVGRGDIPEQTRYLFSDALFAYDIKTGKQLWVHRGASIKKNATCIADGRVFLVDIGRMNDGRAQAVWETYLDSRQKKGKGGKPLQYVDKSTLPDLQNMDALAGGMGLDEDEDELMLDEPPPPKPKENFDRFGKPVPQIKPIRDFKVSALDLRTGKKVWSRTMDLTYCGGDALVSMVSNGVLLFSGNYTEIGHANGILYGLGFFANRRLVAVNAINGKQLWSKRMDPNLRPLIIGDMIISSPYAYSLKTGKQRTVSTNHANKTRRRPWSFLLGGCGIISGCPAAIFGRRGSSSYVDLSSDKGQLTQLPGTRPGCWINMIPAGGLVVETEASSGCRCLYPAQATMVYYSNDDGK